MSAPPRSCSERRSLCRWCEASRRRHRRGRRQPEREPARTTADVEPARAVGVDPGMDTHRPKHGAVGRWHWRRRRRSDGRSTAGRPRQVRCGPERHAWNVRKLQGSSIYRARRQRRLCGESAFRFRIASVPCTSTTVSLTGTVASFKILSDCGQ
jgi:hypothetical protein